MTDALAGILVADFSRVLAGPYATMLLADLGATVVKVERPGAGDDTRAWGPPFAANGQSTYFQSVNRGKRSIALDLDDAADRAVAVRLAARADVLVENHRPGSLARFGLDEPALRLANPGLVYCTISGFGSGAGAGLPGYDLLVQAMGGLMSITGSEDPTKVGVALVDVLTGLHATIGILAALRARESDGVGQHLEISLLTALQSALVNQASAYLGAGVVPGLMGNDHPSIAPYAVFRASDRALALAVGNDTQFSRLVSVLGAPELAHDRRFATNPARVRHRIELRAALEHLLGGASADEWSRRLTEAGVPAGPINDIAQGFDLAEALGLDPVVQVSDARRPAPVATVAHPVRYSRTPARYRSAPPELDEDRAEVLALLDEDAP